jgi:hypothetical protein
VPDSLGDLVPDHLRRHSQSFEHLFSDGVALTEQPEKQMLGADERMMKVARLVSSRHHDSTRLVREALEHRLSVPLQP